MQGCMQTLSIAQRAMQPAAPPLNGGKKDCLLDSGCVFLQGILHLALSSHDKEEMHSPSKLISYSIGAQTGHYGMILPPSRQLIPVTMRGCW